ncbi:MAG: portal protein [Clostridia bacterium]|jgi:hypothetical protein
MPSIAELAQPKQSNSFDKPKAQEKIDRFKELTSARGNMESYWQILHDYFYIEAQDVNVSYAPGNELSVTNLWDATTLECADVLASGFQNYLTPATSKWFKLKPRNQNLAENKAVADFLEDVSNEVYHALNRSNYYDQSFPAFKSSGVYGTSLLLEEEDLEDDIRFHNLPLKQVCIVEDARGRVIGYYIEFEYTALQAATRWGKEALRQELQDELNARQEKKHKFLLFIGKRFRRDMRSETKENLPIEACWIDVDGKEIIEEGGYNEFPAMCHRFDKRPFLPWGFSPAMKALPFARLLNAVAKTNLRAMMKRTDPPIALPDNAFIMPFNANPRAVNYYKRSVMEGGSKDIFAFANYGDPAFGTQAVEYYAQKVQTLMFRDVFLAFEGISKQMQNPEVYERINEKMTLLGPAVGRWTAEVSNPIIQRTIGILFRRGRLPPLPDELIEDPGYEIDYVSQLAQAQRRSELNSLVTALTMTGQMANFSPEILDGVDGDKTRNEIWGITGAPVKVLRSDDEIQKIREARAKQQAQVQQLAMMQEGAKTVQTAAAADKLIAEAASTGRKTLE